MKPKASRTAFSYCRWSHPSQTLGDSEKRQVDRANNYAKQNNLTLSDKRFLDKGISAKDGKNRAKGSAFAKLLEIMQPGDVALIEDYDRFSREDPITSLHTLREILRSKDITIVFMSEGVEVNKHNFMDDAVILPLFLKGFLGYRENTKKGGRINDAWKTKKEKIKNGELVAIALPSWLYSVKHGTTVAKYEVDTTKAQVVVKMFELCCQGKGSGEIAQILNRAKTPNITGTKDKETGELKPYNQKFVLNCLTNKACIGINPLNGNAGYYPRVVEDKVFYVAQQKIAERKVRKVGTKTTDTNIFSRLCFCADPKCNHSLFMHETNGYHYLICNGAKKGLHAYGSINFDHFEHAFLNEMIGNKKFIRSLVNGDAPVSRVPELQGRLAVLKDKLTQMEDDYAKAPSNFVANMAAKTEAEITKLQAELDEEMITQEAYTPFNDALDNILEEFATKYFSEKNAPYRQQLRENLRDVVDKILVNLPKQSFDIHFRNGKTPLSVKLTKNKTTGKTDGYESNGQWSAFGE